jgi:hypothetical protein
MRDLNATVGDSRTAKKIGKYGEHVYNRNAEKLTDFKVYN